MEFIIKKAAYSTTGFIIKASSPYLNELNGYLDELNANTLLEYEAFKLTEQDKLETSIKLAIAWKRSLI